jgi:hypothetical protein
MPAVRTRPAKSVTAKLGRTLYFVFSGWSSVIQKGNAHTFRFETGNPLEIRDEDAPA